MRAAQACSDSQAHQRIQLGGLGKASHPELVLRCKALQHGLPPVSPPCQACPVSSSWHDVNF